MSGRTSVAATTTRRPSRAKPIQRSTRIAWPSRVRSGLSTSGARAILGLANVSLEILAIDQGEDLDTAAVERSVDEAHVARHANAEAIGEPLEGNRAQARVAPVIDQAVDLLERVAHDLAVPAADGFVELRGEDRDRERGSRIRERLLLGRRRDGACAPLGLEGTHAGEEALLALAQLSQLLGL